MEVIYWQLVVAGSVAWLYFSVSRKASLITAACWTLWTLVMIFHAPLVIVQLAVAWGTFFLIDTLKSKNNAVKEAKQRLADLEGATTQYSPSVRNSARASETKGSIRYLKDSEHYQHLIRTIKSADNSVLVLSGWISTSVIDREFIRLLEKKIKNGINIYFGFGYEDSSGLHKATLKSEKALESLVDLSNRCRGSKGKLIVGQFNNHQKILIRDEVEVVCGSHNWLSNRAFLNREQSLIVEDKNLARQAFLEYRKLIESKSIV